MAVFTRARTVSYLNSYKIFLQDPLYINNSTRLFLGVGLRSGLGMRISSSNISHVLLISIIFLSVPFI